MSKTVIAWLFVSVCLSALLAQATAYTDDKDPYDKAEPEGYHHKDKMKWVNPPKHTTPPKTCDDCPCTPPTCIAEHEACVRVTEVQQVGVIGKRTSGTTKTPEDLVAAVIPCCTGLECTPVTPLPFRAPAESIEFFILQAGTCEKPNQSTTLRRNRKQG